METIIIGKDPKPSDGTRPQQETPPSHGLSRYKQLNTGLGSSSGGGSGGGGGGGGGGGDGDGGGGRGPVGWPPGVNRTTAKRSSDLCEWCVAAAVRPMLIFV